MNVTVTKSDYPTKYSVQLTDGRGVYYQRRFTSPQKALSYIKELEQKGHKMASVSLSTFENLLLATA